MNMWIRILIWMITIFGGAIINVYIIPVDFKYIFGVLIGVIDALEVLWMEDVI